MKVILSIIFSCALHAIGEPNTTGYSSCTVKLLPLATGPDGVVLCKTFFQMNEDGGYGYVPVEIGWLVVSAKGIWEYEREIYMDFEQGTRISMEDSLNLQDFSAPLVMAQAHGPAERLIKKYKIDKIVDKHRGEKSISWTKYGVYKNKLVISKDATLKTVMGISNTSAEGTPVHANFYHEGIAIFNSSLGLGENDDLKIVNGAVFLQGQPYRSRTVWLDLFSIDAIAVIKD